MRYVQRDAAGKLVGHYANPQTTRAGVPYTEPNPVPDDHADILAWHADRETRRQEELARSPKVRLPALESEIALLKQRVAELLARAS